jgi:hypothetical protein
LESRPDLPVWLDWVWRAFWELSNDRPIGMALGGITYQAISVWADRHDVRDFDRFHTLIRRMDAVWLEHSRKK